MYYTYIMTNKYHGTLYVGVISDLIRRVYEHKNASIESFNKKYHVKKLVYYEQFDHIYNAIQREKRLKAWQRQWEIDLIDSFNPEWLDLYNDILG